METKYFSLGPGENNRLVKIFRLLFGIVCIAIAIFWMIFNIRALKSNGTLWLTIIFLSGFGFYQMWAGFGQSTIFIEIGINLIRLKKNALLPSVMICAIDIKKIELFPMSVIFFLNTQKRILLRFGTSYYETNEKIKDEILAFAEGNKIPLEIIHEEL